MKKILFKTLILISILGIISCKGSNDPSQWSSKQIDQWFEKGEWLNGWQIKPDVSVNRKAVAISYFKYKDRWDKAFKFLAENDLGKLEPKTYEIDGKAVYAIVLEYMTEDWEGANYEYHRHTIDIQHNISGKEIIGHTPITMKKDVIVPYDTASDKEFLTVNGEGINTPVNPNNFVILFPDEAHRPCLKDGENAPVKKVVVKILID